MTPARVNVRKSRRTCCELVEPPYDAVRSASPAPTPRAAPFSEIVMTAAFEVCHVAFAVTSCLFPSESVAVTVNCVVAPISGIEPEMLIAVTVGVGVTGVEPPEDAVDLPPQPVNKPTTQPAAPIQFRNPSDRK